VAQHFLLSAKARTLSVGAVARMTDEAVETMFKAIRWADRDGKPHCPHCDCPTVYEARRPSGALRFRCKACRGDFSLTSGAIFASHKMPLRSYLLAVAIFCNEVKGKSALALSRDIDCQYKTAFVLCHKLREAMALEMKSRTLGGPGKIVETDGGYFGGYVKPANLKENRRDRRLAANQNGKRQVVVVIRERDGKTLPAVFKSEGAALGFITSRVAKGTEIMADEAASWNDLQARYPMQRIDHGSLCSTRTGVYTNGAEGFFGRMRRAEIGHHHHVAGPYLVRYAQEASWREDNRRVANGDQTRNVIALALASRPSVDWCGYWQRAQKA
jgi:transposase-like protein